MRAGSHLVSTCVAQYLQRIVPLCWKYKFGGLGSWTLSSGGESRAGGFEIIETRVLGPTLVQPLGQAMQARWAHFPIPKRSSCCLPFVCKN